ncbi:5-formyltetrahydrofolate cyclo-ligase [Mameliella alba]|uniref:5-formyltetrahydrofolate cyclo-ligase n=1 Tax=Mameliella alba TaxID=561184 RepID=A0A0B3RTL6_9RHOB|nr:5-formyltetrahydrofolate cyclo-ligase [Mameliella alba]KHQ50108.1 5-formyltetrahydrofolate cyclo-ligase [Mameliella alba]
MGNGSNSFKNEGNFASPPCMAAEVDPGYFDPLTVDPEQERDVARWRTAERKRLREARRTLSSSQRKATGEALMAGLKKLFAGHSAGAGDGVAAFYWPIKDEPDLRPLMTEMHASGRRIALPLVETRAAPLVFRLWTPETRMERGHWNIPVPPRDAPEVMPDVVLAPLMGWDSEGYRLGYGGGYFDRTLAALSPRPFSIGVGLAAAQLPTIYPQPHDIPMDVILTERGTEVGG